MAKIIALSTIKYGGVFHAPSTAFDCDDEIAESLVDRGVAVFDEEKPSEKGNTPEPTKPEGDALIAAIIEAIGQLDPEEDFNADKKPNVKKLEARLGYDITSEQRDVAFDSISAENESDQEPGDASQDDSDTEGDGEGETPPTE